MPRIQQYAERYRVEDFQKALGYAQVDVGLRTIADVAEASGIPATTLWRRWKNPDALTAGELRALLRVLPVSPGAILAFLGIKAKEKGTSQ